MNRFNKLKARVLTTFRKEGRTLFIKLQSNFMNKARAFTPTLVEVKKTSTKVGVIGTTFCA